MLIDWLLYPLLLIGASAGHGLLIRRLAGAPSRLLVLPVGCCSLLVLCTLAMSTSLHSAAWLAIVVPAVLGIGLNTRRSGPRMGRRRIPPAARWPAAAALGAFAAYAAPVVFSGEATFTGYAFIVDIAHHFDLTAWLMDHGHVIPTTQASSQELVVNKVLTSSYPVGFHSLLGAWSELLGRELAWMYQPTVAFAGPMAALAGFALLRQAGLGRRLGALGAFAAAQPNLLYAYSLQAGFKELFSFTAILVVAAVLTEERRGGIRRLAVAAIPIAAAIVSINFTAGPWLAALALPFGVWVLVRMRRWSRRQPARRRRQLAGATIVLTAAAAAAVVRVISNLEIPAIVTAQNDLGNLAAPIRGWASSGIWLTGDYRFPIGQYATLNSLLIAMVIAAAVLGVLFALRRHWPGLAIALAVIVPLAFMVPQTGPWVDAKVFAIDGGLVLLLAFMGLGALASHRWGRVAAWAVGLAIAGGVVAGNGLAYHSTNLAPKPRYSELERIGHMVSGRGPALAPYFDEYAEYFLRDAQGVGRVNPPNLEFPIANGNASIDETSEQHAFVERFRTIVLRRGPERIRPPANYALRHRGRFYDVWEQSAPPASVVAHIVLPVPRTAETCRDLVGQIEAAGAGTRLAWVRTPVPLYLLPLRMRHNPGWVPGETWGSLVTHGPGRAQRNIRIPATGDYAVWLRGSFMRAVTLRIDNRLIGTLRDLPDYPGESDLLGTVHLTAGTHNISLRRGGGNLDPGNGDEAGGRYVGPIALLPADPGPQLFTSSPAAAGRICRSSAPLTWVEILTG